MANDTTVLMQVPEIEGSSSLVGYDPEKGEDGSHVGWIPIHSCSFSFRKDTTVADRETDEEAEAPGRTTRVDPLTIKRSSDNSSAKILMWLADKARKDQVLIDYVVPSGRYYLRYELEDVELVSCSIGYTEPDDVAETLVLTYNKIRVIQRPINISGEVDTDKKHVAEYVVYQKSG